MRCVAAFAFFSLMLALVVWIAVASPHRTPLKLETSSSLNARPDARLVTEQSPYMRTER